MTTQPPSGLGSTGQPLPLEQPAREEKNLLAPIWHTVLVVVVLLANSYVAALIATRVVSHGSGTVTENTRIAQYAFTIAFELFLLFLVWIGLRLNHTKIREVISGRWNTPEAFLLDVAVAFGFWVVAYATLIGLSFAVGLAKTSQMEETKKLAEALAPHSWAGLALFVALSTVAGFVEEIIFRGYLQRQLGALTGNIYIGLAASAAVFGAGHGYEGARRMIVIFVFGMMFGLLALWRKSLRPGMMAHAWHDAFQGALLFIVTRKGLLPMH
jgi:membrane protease YdiL (CAAX protease family)